jgi:hypothetical protein
MGRGQGAISAVASISRVTRKGTYTQQVQYRTETVHYRYVNGEYQIADTATLEQPSGERLEDYIVSLQEQAAQVDLTDATIEMATEYGYYDEVYHHMVISGWRSANDKELAKIEKARAK